MRTTATTVSRQVICFWLGAQVLSCLHSRAGRFWTGCIDERRGREEWIQSWIYRTCQTFRLRGCGSSLPCLFWLCLGCVWYVVLHISSCQKTGQDTNTSSRSFMAGFSSTDTRSYSFISSRWSLDIGRKRSIRWASHF